MKVLFVFAALLLISGCVNQQKLTGAWELWVMVSLPSNTSTWYHGDNIEKTIQWAAIPGEQIRAVVMRNGKTVMEIFNWMDKGSGVYTFTSDISSIGTGNGYTVVVEDDQGFFGRSEEFSVEAARY